MISVVQMWSDESQGVVDWSVSLEADAPELPVEQTLVDGSVPVAAEVSPQVITLRHNDEVYKFSPNTTDEALLAQVAIINQEKN